MSFLSQPVQDILIRSGRKIGDISVQVIISEATSDVLTITKQPVQQGASITDHAYKEPTVLSMQIVFGSQVTSAFARVSLAKTYQDLLDLQNSRLPITVITPKRSYTSMLISTLSVTTDKRTENILSVNVSFQEVIIVNVTTTTVARTKQRSPGKTGATEKAGKKQSGLSSLADGVISAFGAK